MSLNKTLVVVLGPTAVGKTAAGIELAQRLSTEILSADSRQIYKELRIGSAMPSTDELTAIPHHFIGCLSITDNYNVSIYGTEVLNLLSTKFNHYEQMVMVGGSGLYIDAVCKGIDILPDPEPELRQSLKTKLETEGISALQQELKLRDPLYYSQVDLHNPSRLIRALEVCITTGQAYSALRLKKTVQRPFKIVKLGLELPKEILMQRIKLRTASMFEEGLEEEARALLPYRNLNALNTVGYKELFQYFDGHYSKAEATKKIITNTWRYAKRQYTWFRKDPSIQWFRSDEAHLADVLIAHLNRA